MEGESKREERTRGRGGKKDKKRKRRRKVDNRIIRSGEEYEEWTLDMGLKDEGKQEAT